MNPEILDLSTAADRFEHVLPTTSNREEAPIEDGNPISHGSPMDYQSTVSLRGECPSPGDRSEKSLSPLIYRADNEGLSATATLINFLKGMVGPGVLSLPIAFKQSGLWTGFFLVFFFGALSTYCMHQLVHCSRQLSKRIGGKPLSYGSVAYETFAHSQLLNGRLRKFRHLARFSVDLTIVVLQLGICCVQYVFIAAHLREHKSAYECYIPLDSYVFSQYNHV
ncbi:transmembrane amino acid transporter protein [Ditylenchus destructor]|nr:transmembrane amino acid transporter protein [Ditylenchus destructor]